MTETNPAIHSLIIALLRASQSGKIKWNRTVQKNTYRIALGKGMIRIEEVYDPEDYSVGYSLYLLALDGTMVEELHTWTGEAHEILKEIYHSARMSAHNVRELVTSMLADIAQGTTRMLPPEEPDEIPF